MWGILMEKQKLKTWMQENKKKVIAIGVGVLLVIISAGSIALYSTSPIERNNKKVSSNKSEKASKKLEKSSHKKDDKSDKEKEDAKSEDKKSEDKKTEDKKDVTKDTSDTSDKGTSGSSSSGNSNSSGSSGNSDSGSGNSSSKPSGGNSSNSGNNKPAHSHSWEPVYSSVKVSDAWDELVKEAWTETVRDTSKDEYEYHVICSGCGRDFGVGDGHEQHAYEEMLKGNTKCGSSYDAPVLVKEGYSTINHPAEYKHHDAVYKDQITGYKCSCGATK